MQRVKVVTKVVTLSLQKQRATIGDQKGDRLGLAQPFFSVVKPIFQYLGLFEKLYCDI